MNADDEEGHLESASQLINFLSPNCPNIKQLYLINRHPHPYGSSSYLIRLGKPNTSLNRFLWEGTFNYYVYIRLKTSERVKLYTGSTLGLSVINTSQVDDYEGRDFSMMIPSCNKTCGYEGVAEYLLDVDELIIFDTIPTPYPRIYVLCKCAIYQVITDRNS
ncbi:hypothetical protein BD770DRAFT_410400 [Pilaira anomala]|nr:hypothetical protein BD770DRAFT_410400 [Pilaira anomala]